MSENLENKQESAASGSGSAFKVTYRYTFGDLWALNIRVLLLRPKSFYFLILGLFLFMMFVSVVPHHDKSLLVRVLTGIGFFVLILFYLTLIYVFLLFSVSWFKKGAS